MMILECEYVHDANITIRGVKHGRRHHDVVAAVAANGQIAADDRLTVPMLEILCRRHRINRPSVTGGAFHVDTDTFVRGDGGMCFEALYGVLCADESTALVLYTHELLSALADDLTSNQRWDFDSDAYDPGDVVREPNKPLAIAAEARCGSPIEVKLLTALLDDFRLLPPEEINGATARGEAGLLYQQYPVGRYKLDFAIVDDDCRVAIECDGHAYHERTKEQAQHDKERDRYLVGEGWKVLRFTGSEIHANAHKCADEAVEIAKRLW